MWFRPGATAPAGRMDYDGGWELRLFRWIGYLALFSLIVGVPLWYRRAGFSLPGRS